MTENSKQIRFLLCSPGDSVEGGIPAVVLGLRKVFEQLNGVHYKKINYGKPKRNINILLRLFYELIQVINFIITSVSFNSHFNFIQSSFGKKAIIRDTIHLYITLVLRRKFLLQLHGGELADLEDWSKFWYKISINLLKKSTGVIVTSKEEHEILLSLNINKNVYQINNPIVFPRQIPKKKFKTNPPYTIIFASRLIPTKGIEDLLHSIKLIQGDFILKIFGTGSLFDSARNYIIDSNLEKRVQLLGDVSLEDLLVEYANGDIYIFPSYHDEGFPMAFFYALCSSMAIVSTRIRPIKDFLKDGFNCLWIDLKSPRSIANQLNTLLNNQSMIEKFSQNNSVFLELFSPSNIAPQVNNIFESILETQG